MVARFHLTKPERVARTIACGQSCIFVRYHCVGLHWLFCVGGWDLTAQNTLGLLSPALLLLLTCLLLVCSVCFGQDGFHRCHALGSEQGAVFVRGGRGRGRGVCTPCRGAGMAPRTRLRDVGHGPVHAEPCTCRTAGVLCCMRVSICVRVCATLMREAACCYGHSTSTTTM